MKGVYRCRTDGVGIAENEARGTLHVPGYRGDQDIMRIEECLERVVVHENAPVQGVFGVDDPVDASHELAFIGLYRDAPGNLAARVRRLGQVLGEGKGHGSEAGWTDLVVWDRDTAGRIVNDATLTL